MRKKRWIRNHFPYNPLSYQGIRHYRPERNQPHAQLRYREDSDGNVIKTGCDCSGCIAYLQQIARYNPKRFKLLVGIEEYKFFRIKRLHPSEEYRRNRDHAVNYRGYNR